MDPKPASQFASPVLAWAICGLMFGGMVLLGMVWPDPWWGTHFLAFFSFPMAATAWLIGAGLWALGVWKPFALPGIPLAQGLRNWWLLALSLVVGTACYFLPMFADAYGDSAWFGRSFSGEGEMDFWSHLGYALSPNIFHPKSGERTVLNLVWVFMDGFDIGVWEAFRLLGGVCAAIMVWSWGKFADWLVEDAGKRNLLWLIGIGTPVWLLFMGHVEVYAPGLVAILGFFILTVQFLKSGDGKKLIWATLVWLLCVKFHSVAWLLLPVLVLAWGKRLWPDSSRMERILTWRSISLWLLLPVFALGGLVYFVLLGDHADPRFLGEGINVYDRLFLPLLSPEAPLDRYNLLSMNHIGDYFQEMLIWSPAGWSILLVGALSFRKQIRWQSPEMVLIGLALVLMTAFFFMVNPLLGMTVDWDLLAMPAPALWVLAGLVIGQADLSWKRATGPLLAIAIWITIPAVVMHQQPPILGQRLESLGRHSFKTYWIRSSGTLLSGIDLRRGGPNPFPEDLMATLSGLEGYAIPGDDHEYGFLLMEIGEFHRKTLGNMEKALHFHNWANKYTPRMENNVLGMMEANFLLGNFKDAYAASKTLVELEYPNPRQAQRIAIHCALEAGIYADAEQRVRVFLESWPEDALLNKIQAAFEKGEDPSQLKFLFQRQ